MVWFFASVNTFVVIESAEVSKCFVTQITMVRCFAGMNAFMNQPIAGPGKYFVTYITMVWCFICVDAFVYPETLGRSKCFVTYITITYIPFNTSMNSFVSRKTFSVIKSQMTQSHTNDFSALQDSPFT